MSSKQSKRRRAELPEYTRKILAAYDSGRIPAVRGTVGHITVWHEPWCRRPAGEPCTCGNLAELGEVRWEPTGGAA